MKIQFEFQEKAIRMLKAGIEELEESNQVGKNSMSPVGVSDTVSPLSKNCPRHLYIMQI